MDYSRLVESIVDELLEATRYHATSRAKSRIVSIANKGLLPNTGRKSNYQGLNDNIRGRLFVTGNTNDAEEWANDLYDSGTKRRQYPTIFRINNVNSASFKRDEVPSTDTDEYTTETIPPEKLDVWHAKTGFTPLSAHAPEAWKKVKQSNLDPFEKPKGQMQLFPKELYTESINSVVDELLEVEVLPDAFITKAADGSWEKKEAAPGTVSPLSKAGIRSPRVNMGMKTPTTTFLPFAGLSPAVKEVRDRTGDEDVRVVPGAAESSAVLLKTSPKAKDFNIKQMSAYAGKTPHEFASDVGRSHLIILGPASKMKAGLETQKAIFGHEAGHVLNKDTQRFNSVRTQNLDISDKEIVDREEGAWKTGNALLKDMGMTSDPHIEKAALHTYYDERDPAKADISNLNADEASSLYHLLKQPDSYSKDTFRVGSKTFFGPDHFMKNRFAKVTEALSEVTLPKYINDWNHTHPDTVDKLDKSRKIVDNAWTKESEAHGNYEEPSKKLSVLSDTLVYFDRLRSAADLRGGQARPKHHEIAKEATEQQTLTRAQRGEGI